MKIEKNPLAIKSGDIFSEKEIGHRFRFFPGEQEAIKKVCELGKTYGYGNLIHRLRNAWSRDLQNQGMDKYGADLAAGHICVWCKTDSRTGKKRKDEKTKIPEK